MSTTSHTEARPPSRRSALAASDASTVHTTSAGPVSLPIVYGDASSIFAMFDADAQAAAALARPHGLHPSMRIGKRAVVVLAFYEYRRSTVGAYREVGTAIFAQAETSPRPLRALVDLYRAPSKRHSGALVVDLPVTTEIARAAGRELWGYPKFVTEIQFELGPRRMLGAVLDPDGAGFICTLTGGLGRGVPAPAMSVATYTTKDHELLRTHVDVRGRARVHLASSARLHVGPSRHPMAERLRALGLDGKRPLMLLVAPHFEAWLHEGMPVEPRGS